MKKSFDSIAIILYIIGMLKNIQHKQNFIFIMSFLLALTTENLSFAFENFGTLKNNVGPPAIKLNTSSNLDKINYPDLNAKPVMLEFIIHPNFLLLENRLSL